MDLLQRGLVQLEAVHMDGLGLHLPLLDLVGGGPQHLDDPVPVIPNRLEFNVCPLLGPRPSLIMEQAGVPHLQGGPSPWPPRPAGHSPARA